MWRDSLVSERVLILQSQSRYDLHERESVCTSSPSQASFHPSLFEGSSTRAHSFVTVRGTASLARAVRQLRRTAETESSGRPRCWARGSSVSCSLLSHLTGESGLANLRKTDRVKTGHKSLQGHFWLHWAGQAAPGQKRGRCEHKVGKSLLRKACLSCWLSMFCSAALHLWMGCVRVWHRDLPFCLLCLHLIMSLICVCLVEHINYGNRFLNFNLFLKHFFGHWNLFLLP